MVPVFVAVKFGVMPETALLFASNIVIVTVEVATPSASTGPVPLIVELVATAVPAIKVTVPSALETGVVIDSVFTSALRDLSEQVETPLESVALQEL